MVVWSSLNIPCSGIPRVQRESGYQKRLRATRTRTRWRRPMIKFTFLGVAAILSTAIATPVFAQAVIQEPGAYAFSYPDGDSGIGSTPSQRQDAVVVGRGTAGAMASAPSIRTPAAGFETTTRPWSAPVGHRQPRAADVPTSSSVSQQILDQEDANVDRKIRSVCRGC